MAQLSETQCVIIEMWEREFSNIEKDNNMTHLHTLISEYQNASYMTAWRPSG